MKKILILLLLTPFSSTVFSQVFWTEDFSSTTSTWTINVTTGTEGAEPNFFTISDNEGGGITPDQGAPISCGVANNMDSTLHITSVTFPTNGASYDAGGFCPILACPLTNRRAESPIINCTGKNNISVNFNYIENGDGVLDNASLWYFSGASWTLLDDMPKTLTGCTGQGLWTSRTVLLPASANNNSNIKIGFSWVNNDDGVGTDPSFAVDDISLSTVSTGSSISTDTLGLNHCSCDTINVGFTSSGAFNGNNIYTAELSDVLGTFNTPTSIGSISSSADSGTINAVIPCNAAFSNTYRIRVVSSAPAIAGSDNGSNITINASFTPNASINATPSSSACIGDPISFIVSSANAGSNPTYQWKLNGSLVGTNTNTYVNNTLNNNDMITCEVSSTLPCANGLGISNAIVVNIVPNTAPTINITTTPGIVTTGINTTYTATIPSSISAYQLSWYLDGNLVSTATNPNNTYTNTPGSLNDSVYAILTPTSGCYAPDSVASNTVLVLFPDGTNNFNKAGVRIYPNPSNNLININGLQANDKVVLLNAFGQQIDTSVITLNANKQINIAALPAGIYIIKLTRNGARFTQRVSKY